MNKLFLISVCLWTIVGFCAEGQQDLTPEQKALRRMKYTGGRIQRPGAYQGKVAVVNSQDRFDFRTISSFVDAFVDDMEIHVDKCELKGVTVKNAAAKVAELSVGAAVFVVDDSESSIRLLSAPEERWAIVNVAPIAADGTQGEILLSRIRKETYRGLLLASGAMDSQTKGSLMGPVKQTSDIDALPEELPFDVMVRMTEHLKAHGVTRSNMVTYRNACVQGWAPAPTNDFQKAIWDEIHAAPTSPMRILPETKKQ